MATTTPDYTINYEDERFAEVEAERDVTLTEAQKTYGNMIENADSMYDGLKESAQKWADTQTDIQNQQTEFTIQQIEQEKANARKDYEKEQAGAYVDWRKQSNQYGVEAEKMASAGLANTGYSESSQVSMYNTYQNRVATARESFQRSWDNFNNKIIEARIQNNAALAEIACQAFEKQAEYTLQAFQYKNSLITELFDREMQVKQFYADQWQNVLSQMNTENAMAEEIRQFNENQIWQTEQNQLNRDHETKLQDDRQTFEAAEAVLDRDHETKLQESEQAFKAAEAVLDREHDKSEAALDREHDKAMVTAKTEAEKEVLEKQHELDIKELDKKHENDKALLAYQYGLQNKDTGGSSGGSKGGSTTTSKNSGGSGMGAFTTNAAGGTSKNPTQDSLTYKGAPVDMQSIINLGYGPISASKLADLISQGKVILTKRASDAKYVAKLNTSGVKGGFNMPIAPKAMK